MEHMEDSDSDDELWFQTMDLLGMPGRRARRRALWQWKHEKTGTKPREVKRLFRRLDWKRHVNFLGAKEFRRYYKLTPENFEKNLTRIAPHIKAKEPKCKDDVAVPERIRFAVTLRWLAGGHYADICLVHGISKTSFYDSLQLVIYALLVEFAEEELGTQKFTDPDWLTETELTFARLTGGAVRNCIFALDGMAVRIARPAESQCPNPMAYYSRKGFFSVVLQAMCDGNCRFTWASMKAAGSTHDSTAWCITDLARLPIHA